MSEGSWVGLDVHARSVVAGVIDVGSGEVRSLRVPPGCDARVAWLTTLPAPVRVAYEAGPTGYRLARACAEAGIGCVVAAPSRIRPAADRVKTDRRDAERLARLLRLGEITPIRVPGPEEEAARDLVRAREDARGDLMRARHRLSKLLLRHGSVYDGTAWTRAHDVWLRRQRFQSGPLAIVFDECYGRMLDAKTRRDALDKAIAELAAMRSRPEASPARSSWSPSRASSPDTAGRSQRWSSRTSNGSARRAHRRNDARSDPREHSEQPSTAMLDARDRHRSSSRTPGHAAPTRAYESRHRLRRQPVRSPRRHRTPQQRGN